MGYSLTAEFLRSPLDGNAAHVTFVGVFGKRRAQAFAITAHVASARIEHAPIDIHPK